MYNLKNAGPEGHYQIIRLGAHFRLVLGLNGCCDGVAYSGISSLVSGDFSAFETALAALSQVQVNELRYSTIQAYQQAKTRAGVRQCVQLELAFSLLGQITVIQKYLMFTDLLNRDSGESLKQQAINHFITQKIILSKKINFYKSCDRQGLRDAIEALQACVKQHKLLFGLVLFAARHAIGIGWDYDHWVLVDANALPVKRCKNAQEVADFVFKGFTFEYNEPTDGFVIEFTLVAKASEQSLVENILFDWRNTQHAGRLAHIKSLSKAEINMLFFTGVEHSDISMVKQIDDDPRIEVNVVPYDSNSTMLYKAVDNNDFAMVQYLLTFDKIDVNLGGNEFTPLHLAADRGYTEIAKLLLAHPNIDINRLANRLTAMDIAKKRKHDDIVNLIRNHGREDAENMRRKRQKM